MSTFFDEGTLRFLRFHGRRIVFLSCVVGERTWGFRHLCEYVKKRHFTDRIVFIKQILYIVYKVKSGRLGLPSK